jgi:hypothetical protein
VGWAEPGACLQSKRVREYINLLYVTSGVTITPQAREADEAFRFFGTNSVPYIRAALREKETWGQRALWWVAHKAPWLRLPVQNADYQHTKALCVYHTILQQGYWGSAGAACETEVSALTSDPNPATRRLATMVRAEMIGWDER